jgi:hypothetical protein
MSCKLHIATEVKQDMLACNDTARRQIRAFLLALQENPLPEGRRAMGEAAFYVQLPSGFYLSWEIIGNVLRLVLTGNCEGILVRVLGVSRVLPPEKIGKK